jgi:hypothetical protein
MTVESSAYLELGFLQYFHKFIVVGIVGIYRNQCKKILLQFITLCKGRMSSETTLRFIRQLSRSRFPHDMVSFLTLAKYTVAVL